MANGYEAAIEILGKHGIEIENDPIQGTLLVWTAPSMKGRYIAPADIGPDRTPEEISSSIRQLADPRSMIYVEGDVGNPQEAAEAIEGIRLSIPDIDQEIGSALREAQTILRGVVIRTGERPEDIEIEADEEGLALEALQHAVGGRIELFSVLFDDGIDLYINDDGLFRCAPNRAIYANAHMEESGYLSQIGFTKPVKEGELYTIIHGDIVAVGYDSREGRSRSLTDDEAETVRRYFTEVSEPGSGFLEALVISAGSHPMGPRDQREQQGANLSTMFGDLIQIVAEERDPIGTDMTEPTR